MGPQWVDTFFKSSLGCNSLLSVSLINKINNLLNMKSPKSMHLCCKAFYNMMNGCSHAQPVMWAMLLCSNIKQTFSCQVPISLYLNWFICALQTTTAVGLILKSLGNRVEYAWTALHLNIYKINLLATVHIWKSNDTWMLQSLLS